MDNSKSLVIAKKGLLQKIQDFLRKIFKRENEVIKEVEVKNDQDAKEKFINELKNSSNTDIKELIIKIQNGEVCLDEKNDEELIEIEDKLDRYLQYLEQEIQTKKIEISSLQVATVKNNQ